MADETLMSTLAGPNDPAAVEWVHPGSQSPILLVCEHAGQAIPAQLDGLGLPGGAIDLHIGWDIGAERLARSLAAKLGAPLILQRYSRLVMDCNRPPCSSDSMPEISDRMAIPGNQRLSAHARRERQRLIFDPLDAAITDGFERFPRKAAFSIHSFTRQMQQDERRVWDAGFLCRHDLAAAQTFVDSIGRAEPGLRLAVNEPYQIDDAGDWFIPHHAEQRKLRHTLIEVCNDQLRTDTQISRWTDLIARAMQDVLEATP